jgi:hypothetical protein
MDKRSLIHKIENLKLIGIVLRKIALMDSRS